MYARRMHSVLTIGTMEHNLYSGFAVDEWDMSYFMVRK